MPSHESCPYMDESELELTLGGVPGKARISSSSAGGTWDRRYTGVLTCKKFSSVVSASSSSSSSSSAAVADQKSNGSAGNGGTAKPSSPPGRSGVGQVVGWPPVRNYRVNCLANHLKPAEASSSTADKCEVQNIGVDKTNCAGYRNADISKEKGVLKTSFLVKVNMDGFPIGRKVDLNAHTCYETLAQTLDSMFSPCAAVTSKRSNVEEQAKGLLDGSSDLVLAYEDKDGDWMLVGDIPWEMFLSSVKRLRIMRAAEANGLGVH